MRVQRIVALVLLLGIVLGYVVAPLVSLAREPTSRLMAFPDPEKRNWEQLDHLEGILSGDRRFEVMGIIGSPTILRDVKDPQKTLYIAVGIEKKYRPAELDILQDFVKRGGKAIIADDTGYADDLSNRFGVTYYSGKMWDQNYLNNESFPLIPATLLNQKFLLVLSSPTGLANQTYDDPDKGEFKYTMIGNGSDKSYVDRNGNGYIDPADAHDNIPVALEVNYNPKANPGVAAGGRIIFISDSSIMTNDMLIDTNQLLGWMNNPPGGTYAGFNILKMSGTNREFVLSLILSLLPGGGKVIFDESRHPRDKWTAAAYDSITSLTIVTSNPLEAGLLSTGIILILMVVVFRARDKESWIHRFDISSVHRRAFLPDTRTVQVDHLRKAMLQKLRMLNSLSAEELRALTPAQLAQMIKDHDLNELLLNEQKAYTPEEIRALTAKLRAWGKV